MIKKGIYIILYLLILLVIIFQCKYIANMPWSPIDEYAHYDYILKLCKGKMPTISDTIEKELILEIQQNPQRNMVVENHNNLGLAGYSYQAKHPPLYYIILCVPEKCMQFIGMSIFKRLIVLRIISFFFIVLASFIVLCIRKQMQKLGFIIPYTFVLLYILWTLFTYSNTRYGLGNNSLSLLFTSITLYTLLLYNNNREYKALFFFSICLSLSILASLTNLFICLPFIIYLVLLWHKSFKWNEIIILLLATIPSILLFIIWKSPQEHHTPTAQFITQLLKTYIPTQQVDFPTFLFYLLKDISRISFLPTQIATHYFHISILILSIISLCVLFSKKTHLHKGYNWLLIAFILFIYWIVVLYILHHYIAGVTWVAFRHYIGFYPIVFTILFTFYMVIHIFLFKKRK